MKTFIFLWFFLWYNTNSNSNYFERLHDYWRGSEIKIITQRKKIAIKRDKKFNQTAPRVIVFNPNWIPTPDKQTAEDLLAEDKYSLLLPSLQKTKTQARNIFRAKQTTFEPSFVTLKKQRIRNPIFKDTHFLHTSAAQRQT